MKPRKYPDQARTVRTFRLGRWETTITADEEAALSPLVSELQEMAGRAFAFDPPPCYPPPKEGVITPSRIRLHVQRCLRGLPRADLFETKILDHLTVNGRRFRDLEKEVGSACPA